MYNHDYNRITLKDEDRTIDPSIKDRYKKMSENMKYYFKDERNKPYHHREIEYYFRNVKIVIDGISADLLIEEFPDYQFNNDSANIIKYGTFKVTKTEDLLPKTQLEEDTYSKLSILYDFQNNEDSQNSIRMIVNDLNEKMNPHYPYSIPIFLRSDAEAIHPFNRNNYHQERRNNLIDGPTSQFKYTLTGEIMKPHLRYHYKCKIACRTFMLHFFNDNCDNYYLASSNFFPELEDAIEALFNAVNTYKLFEDKLLSPLNYERAILERELFPLSEDFNCCICHTPTTGFTSCGHKICFKCRYSQVTKNRDSKRTRCPVCRHKNELKNIYDPYCESDQDEGD